MLLWFAVVLVQAGRRKSGQWKGHHKSSSRRSAEPDAGVLDQQAENHERMLELMALVHENARRHDADHSETQLKARIALLEQMRRHTLTTQHETLAQQHRQLAEHYERLAAEQRKLAEEVERVQREAGPAT